MNNTLSMIKFTEADIQELSSIIETGEQAKIVCTPQMSGIWLKGEDTPAELRLLILSNYRITVSRVEFVNKRRGTMKNVLRYLEEFARKNGIKEILVQCVQTKEMVNWCNKNGFAPVPTACLEIDGVLMGDYAKPTNKE